MPALTAAQRQIVNRKVEIASSYIRIADRQIAKGNYLEAAKAAERIEAMAQEDWFNAKLPKKLRGELFNALMAGHDAIMDELRALKVYP